jgi:hypothetical protein
MHVARVRRFRLKNFFASKRNEAKRDPFRFVFACSSENTGPIFSLVFASFRFEFFVSLRSEKIKTIFSLPFALQIFFSLHFLQSQTFEHIAKSSVVDPHHFFTAQAACKKFR